MRRMPLSADTAVKLAKHLNVPLEHLMHMPQHILLQKIAELSKKTGSGPDESSGSSNGQDKQ